MNTLESDDVNHHLDVYEVVNLLRLNIRDINANFNQPDIF